MNAKIGKMFYIILKKSIIRKILVEEVLIDLIELRKYVLVFHANQKNPRRPEPAF